MFFFKPNVREMEKKRDVNGLIRALKYKDPDVRRDAVWALGRLGDPRAVEPLIAVLKNDKEGHVRSAAAYGLGKLKDHRAVEPLVTALKDEDLKIREEAAVALGKIGDPRAVEPLISILKSGGVNARSTAAELLGNFDDPKVVEPLITTLKDKNESWKVRKAAAEVLGKIGDPRAVEALIDVLSELKDAEDMDMVVVQSVVKALGELGDPKAVEPLVAALKDEAWNFKEFRLRNGLAGAARTASPIELLGVAEAQREVDNLNIEKAIGEALVKILSPESAVNLFLLLLRNEHSDVQRVAIWALNKLDWKPDQDENAAWYWITKEDWERCVDLGTLAVEPLISVLRDKNRDLHVRRMVASHLGKIGDPRAVEALISILQDEKEDSELQFFARASLVEVGSPVVEPLISALMGNRRGRSDIVRTLRELRDRRGVEPLISVLKDDDRWYVRSVAAEALGKIGDPRAVEPLIATLRDENSDVRKNAAEALRKITGNNFGENPEKWQKWWEENKERIIKGK